MTCNTSDDRTRSSSATTITLENRIRYNRRYLPVALQYLFGYPIGSHALKCVVCPSESVH